VNAQRTPRIPRSALAAAAVAALALTACGSDDDASGDDTEQTNGSEESASTEGVEMADPWSRQPAEGQTNSAVYGILTNNTNETITAIAATTSVTDTVELHEVLTNDEGQMSMQEREGGYEIAAGESLTFEPGGPHIMLLDIDPAGYPDVVDVTLMFDDDSSIDFTAEVREVGADMDMDDSDMDDSDMDMDDSDMDMDMDDSES
jgi:copper(I)-binding protein